MTTIPLVDPATIRPYYIERGLSLELLNKCNSQEFKYIDGVGLGYWLTTTAHSPTGDVIDYDIDTLSIDLPIISITSIEHPSYATEGLIVVKTAEPKYLLTKFSTLRNYNVIDPKTISGMTYTTLAPDATAKTIEEIIDDLLTGTPFTLTYTGTTVPVLNVFIEGLSVFDAIDRICSIYGMIWTASNSIVYVAKVDTTPVSTTRVNDVRDNTTDPGYIDIDISFLKVKSCLEGPPQYHIDEDSGTGKGRTATSYDPYYPAFLDDSGTVLNSVGLTSRASIIRDNFQLIGGILGNYVAKHIYETPTQVPARYLSVTYGDLGAGPRSIFRSDSYPFFQIPYPYEKQCPTPSGHILFQILSVVTAGSTSPYNGLNVATVVILDVSCEMNTDLIGTEVDVVDRSGCIFDLPFATLVNIKGWATQKIALSLKVGDPEGTLTPCHWAADNRCCP